MSFSPGCVGVCIQAVPRGEQAAVDRALALSGCKGKWLLSTRLALGVAILRTLAAGLHGL